MVSESVHVDLHAPWAQTPFKLNVLQAFSAYNETLYASLVEKLVGIDYEGDDMVLVEDQEVISDKAFYAYAQTLVANSEDLAILNVEIANKLHSAFVQSHYAYFEQAVRAKNPCDANLVMFDGSNADVSYCNPDAAFVLQTTSDSSYMPIKDIKLPIDHILGRYYNQRVYVIYGDFTDTNFRQMFFNMYQLVKSNEVTLLWRYTHVDQTTDAQPESLVGYGAYLNVKDSDYVSIDKRHDQDTIKLNSEEGAEQISEDLSEIKAPRFVEFINYKFTKYVLSAEDKLHALVDTLANFPKLAHFIGEQNYDLEHLTNIEQDSYQFKTPEGLFINGAFITDTKNDIFEVLKTIKNELKFINIFDKLSIDVATSKKIMNSFATKVLETFNSPLKRFNIMHYKKIIGYINNIALDKRYEDFVPTREAYKKAPPNGQLPSARENIHDMVFVMDLTDKLQLEYFLQCANRVLEAKFPIRIGVIPLRDASQYSELATNKFYGTSLNISPQDSLTFLNMLNRFVNGKEGLNLMSFRALDFPYLKDEQKDLMYKWLEEFYQDFSIRQSEPIIMANGVMFPFGEINQALGQLFQDDSIVFADFNQKVIPENVKLGNYIRKDGVQLRSPRILPQTLGGFRSTYSSELPDLKLYNHLDKVDVKTIQINQNSTSTPTVINLFGSLVNQEFLDQLKQVKTFLSNYKRPLKLRIFDFSGSEQFQALDNESLLTSIDDLKRVTKDNEAVALPIKTFANSMFGISLDDLNLAGNIIIAGRHTPLGKQPLSYRELRGLINFENNSRLKHVRNIVEDNLLNVDFLDDDMDRLDYLTWALSKTYFFSQEEFYLSEAFPRLALEDLPHSLRVDSTKNTPNNKLDVNLVINPVSEIAQKFSALIPLLESFDFVNLNVYLKPDTLTRIEEVPVKKFYKAKYLTEVDFSNGSSSQISIEDLPKNTIYSLGVDVPQRWLVIPEDANADLDNVYFSSSSGNENVSATYQLKNLLVEGYAYYDVANGYKIAPANLPLELKQNGESIDQSPVMANYGYFQLKAQPGLYQVNILANTKGSQVFQMDSNKNDIWVSSLDGKIIRPGFSKVPGKELTKLVVKPESKPELGFMDQIKSFFGKFLSTNGSHPHINVFSIASGKMYERFMKIMMVSVMQNAGSTVKFWLLENYLSPEFKKELPKLSEYYGFEYQFVSFRWPIWLQNQTEKQREVWAYKILFLDMIFPQDLDRVVVIDADNFVMTDLDNLVDKEMDLEAYAFPPIGSSRKETEGFRFWEEGSWKETLGEDGVYYTSSIFLVDLPRFREIAAGDLLRQQYRVLSKDEESLSNLDQDLPNSMQNVLPIHPLDQSWVWCETWCDDASKKQAKTIDMCQNPNSKESKLSMAQRLIPGWQKIDDEINSVIQGTLNKQRYRDEL